MPILQVPENPQNIMLPPRQAVLGGQAQVLVVGGGPAGLGAAVGAAAAGADVILAERYGFLGGNATVALVMPLMSFHNEKKQAVPGENTAADEKPPTVPMPPNVPPFTVVSTFAWLPLTNSVPALSSVVLA